MKGKDEIADLFKEGLNDFETNVDPSIWNGVQSGLNSAASSAGSAASSSASSAGAAGKISIVTKSVIGVTTAAAISVGTYFAINTASEVDKNEKTEVLNNDSEETQEVEDLIQEQPETSEKEYSAKDVVEENEPTSVMEPLSNDKPITNEDDVAGKTDESVVNSTEEKETESTVKGANENTISSGESASDKGDKSTSVEDKEEIVKPDEQENDVFREIVISPSILKHDNQFIELDAGVVNADEIIWEMGDGSTLRGNRVQHYYEDAGNYEIVVYAYNDYEEKETILSVEVNKVGKILRIPNVFHPNQDGLMDEFFVLTEGIEEFNLTVFNKSQEIVYQTNDPDFIWRGMHYRTNDLVPKGHYSFVIMAVDKMGNTINKHEKLEIR